MIPATLIIVIAFIWLLIETNYMRVRLPFDSSLVSGLLEETPKYPNETQAELLYRQQQPGTAKFTIELSTLKVPLLYLTAIGIAELIVALVNPLVGIILHIVLLLGLIFHASNATEQPHHRLYLALSLAPLIRLLSLSLPMTNFSQIYWYAITGAPLLVATFLLMRRLNLRPDRVGFTINHLSLQLVVALSGILLGIAEYYILKPTPLISSLSWQALLLPAIILLIGTGFVEEFIFRGVMQRVASEALGRWGIIFVAVLFAILHIGYLSLADFGLVLVAGLFFGWVVQKTGSLFGVTLSHGITNTLLYLVIPLLI